ncbi:MAG: putative PEP-binding protein [Crocosphaera sp.]
MIKLYWLSEVNPQIRPIIGEKAWTLSQLLQSGYPIFPGFVISSNTFKAFLENLNDVNSLLADFPESSLHLDVDNPRILQSVAQQSRQSILSLSFPDHWKELLEQATAKLDSSSLILRTSLSGNFSRNQDISGLAPAQVCWNIGENLEIAIKEIWSQLLNAKSLFYWQRLGIKIEQLNLAILVQPMVDAISSGVSINHYNSIKIQGNWGLGHSLLQGKILADYWKINSLSGDIIEKKIGKKPCAYRLKNNKITDKNCLESYLVSPRQQDEYCLDTEGISQIFQINKKLQKSFMDWSSLEWICYHSAEDSSPQIAITQLIQSPYNLSFQETKPATITASSQSQLQGVAASPGRIQGIVHLLDHNSDSTELTKGIIVAQKIHPFQLSSLKQASGIITEEGGITSHAAILARELGIPAVVSIPGATSWLQTGDSILLDGDTGTISLNTLNEEKMSLEKPLLSRSTAFNYPIGTRLMVNLSQPSSLKKVMGLPLDGLGLVRSELMLLDLCTPQPLKEWLRHSQQQNIIAKLTQRITEFADFFAPCPIFYRTFDDKFSVDQDRRGTAGYCLDSNLFCLELQALLQVQQQGYNNLNIILPFVRTVDEFRLSLELIKGFQLTASPDFQVWIMAEVPSVIFELSNYVKAGVQGIAIGTNDLIPLLLGIERNKIYGEHFSSAYQSAVFNALKQLVLEAKRLQIPSSICGQIVVNSTNIIEHLVSWGITHISVEPEAVETTYEAIARVEKRLILDYAREKMRF